MTCDNCGATTSNGIALCQACRAWFLVNLEFVPVYFRNLARWRPSSASGVRTVPGSRPPSAAGATNRGDRIGRALEETSAELSDLAVDIAKARRQFVRLVDRINDQGEEVAVALTCSLLTKYVDTFATLPDLQVILGTIASLEQRLRRETERAIPGWYAGMCARCDTSTHVVPGLTWVTCAGCGTTTNARDHLDIILDEAAGWVAPPMRIAEALVALLDRETSAPRLYKRISKWGERGQVDVVRKLDDDGDPTGPKRYRLGQVLTELNREQRVS